MRLVNPCEEYAANQNHRKYDASFKDSNYSFCAMVFETLGALNREGTEVLKQMFCFAAKHLGREFTSYCVRAWARVSCTLQRSVAQAILNRTDGNTERVLESAEEGGPLGEAESVAFFPEVPPEIPPYSKLSPSGSVHLAPVDSCVSSPEKKERKGEEGEGGSVAVAARSSSGSSRIFSKKFRGGWAAAAVSSDADVSQYLSGSVVA